MSGQVLTARAAGQVACTRCGAVWAPRLTSCPRCHARLASRPVHGLGPVWAWWVAGLLLYIPANIWPMLVTRTLGREEASTILGGVVELANHGSWGIAAIVFIASIAIPVSKFAAIGLLALAVRHRVPIRGHGLMVLYEVVEFIGRWSMIDIFVVAILSALVQLGFLASLAPGPAAACFALSVAFTMLAARAFDPRLIWDRIGEDA
ncbi:MAG: paraquat-inducible protein A [Pseudomonadota bacterium]